MHRPASPPPPPVPPCRPPPPGLLLLAYWKRLAGTAIQHVPKKHRLLPHWFLTALLFTVLGVVHDPTRKYVKNKCRFTIRSIACRGVQRLFLLLPSTAGLCELFFSLLAGIITGTTLPALFLFSGAMRQSAC